MYLISLFILLVICIIGAYKSTKDKFEYWKYKRNCKNLMGDRRKAKYKEVFEAYENSNWNFETAGGDIITGDNNNILDRYSIRIDNIVYILDSWDYNMYLGMLEGIMKGIIEFKTNNQLIVETENIETNEQ